MTTAPAPSALYTVRLARTAEEIRASQALRYRVFGEEMGASLQDADDGLDHDAFDAHCRHLLVIENRSGKIVASTRLLDNAGAARAGGFYSAGEFVIDNIAALPGRLLEVGRTCVDPDYRSGAVIALLWQGLAQFVVAGKYDYLFGCASIDLRQGTAQAGAALHKVQQHVAPPALRVSPKQPLPRLDTTDTTSARLPPLLKAYLSLGAVACGAPCWDQDFQCADVLMLLCVADMAPRYARHFMARPSVADHAPLAA